MQPTTSSEPSDSDGPLLPGVSQTSAETQRLVDDEVRRLVDDAHAEVTQLLTEHRNQLDSPKRALLKAETLDASDAYAAAGAPKRAAALNPQAPPGRKTGATHRTTPS